MLVRKVFAVSLLCSLFISVGLFAQTRVTQADVNRLKAGIELLKQDIEIKEAELKVLELQMARQSPTNVSSLATKPAAATAKTPEPAPPSPVVTRVPTPIRTLVDPAPYEASIEGRVPQFRTNQSAKWLVLDESRLVFWVVDDEAYMLNLDKKCTGLFDTNKILLESFSSKVRAGHDGVVFSGKRCSIESVFKLSGRLLPKPPRK